MRCAAAFMISYEVCCYIHTTVPALWNGSECPYYVILAPPPGKYPTLGQVLPPPPQAGSLSPKPFRLHPFMRWHSSGDYVGIH